MATKRLKYTKSDGTKVYQLIVKLKHVKTESGNPITKSTMLEVPKKIRPNQLQDYLSGKAIEYEKTIKHIYQGYDVASELTPTSTFGEVAEKWLEELELDDKSPLHQETSRNHIQKECKPLLNESIDDITPKTLQAFFDTLDRRTFITTKIVGRPEQFREAMKNARETFTSLRKLFPESTICKLLRGNKGISIESAERMAQILKVKVDDICQVTRIENKYAPKTNHLVKGTVRMVMAFATRKCLIPYNYAKAEYIKYPPVSQKPPKCMTKDKLVTACKSARKYPNKRAGIFVELCLLTGMRKGEVRGLKWDAINLDSGEIMVVSNVVDAEIDGVRQKIDKDPKTPRSRRIIEMPQNLVEQLREYREYYFNQKSLVGGNWTCHKNYIFANWETGEPVASRTMKSWADNVTIDAGIGQWNIHSFRHTNISVKLLEDTPLSEVSAVAGHGNPSVTYKMYSHDINKANRVGPGKLDDLLNDGDDGNDGSGGKIIQFRVIDGSR